MCIAPIRSSSFTRYPPLETTIAFPPAAMISEAISMQPCSAPPAPRAGIICIMTGCSFILFILFKNNLLFASRKEVYISLYNILTGALI